MNVLQKNMTTIWPHPDLVGTVQLIDQRFLPHRLVIESVDSAEVMAQAIENMHVRGAPLIGVAAAFGVAIAAHRIMENNANDENWRNLLDATISRLAKTRPTAVNLFWALQKQRNVLDASDSLVAVKNAPKRACPGNIPISVSGIGAMITSGVVKFLNHATTST